MEETHSSSQGLCPEGRYHLEFSFLHTPWTRAPLKIIEELRLRWSSVNVFDKWCSQITFELCGALLLAFSTLGIVRADVNRDPKAGPPVSAPKSCLPFNLFQAGKGDGWNGHPPVMAPSRTSLPRARPTFSPRDKISLKSWAENLNFKCVQAAGCGKVLGGKVEAWKFEIYSCLSFLRMIWHWLMLVFFLPKKEYVHL